MATISPSKEVNKLYDKLLGYFNPKDQAYINRAFQYAYDGHNGQNRKSGEPYITHPLHVALYLCELNFDKETIAAALLHDLIEDTDVSYEDLKKEFGEEVADIVDGVTKSITGTIGKAAHILRSISAACVWTSNTSSVLGVLPLKDLNIVFLCSNIFISSGKLSLYL